RSPPAAGCRRAWGHPADRAGAGRRDGHRDPGRVGRARGEHARRRAHRAGPGRAGEVPEEPRPPVHPRGTEACGPQAPQPPRGIDPGRRDVAPGGGCGAGTDPQALTDATLPTGPVAGGDVGARRTGRTAVRIVLVLTALALAA